VIARESRTKLVGPGLVLAALGVGLAVLPGCDTQGYSEDMTYPVRSDVMVIQSPPADPKHFASPGQWAYLLPAFDDPAAKGKKFDPTKLSGEQRAAINRLLKEHFETPAKPTVKGIDEEAKAKLKLDDKVLVNGSQLYRRHCLHCHGLTGDGHGPTAPWVNPHPRDYRPGIFKFTSTIGGKERKPSRDDLIRTLRQGIEGTSMPSFGLLPEEQLNDIISYVMHLSIRGTLEYRLINLIFVEDSDKPASVGVAPIVDEADSTLNAIVTEWTSAQNESIPVAPFPADLQDLKSPEGQDSIKRGHAVFLLKEGKCIECHADYGRQLAYKYDDWGTIVRPRDVTAGVLRGGRRPIDIYYRLFNGINGTPMPAFVNAQQLNDEKYKATKTKQVWDLVNFIRAVPYPGMLPKDVRDQVYRTDKSPEVHAAAAIRD
jgi:mono/diheme cytochrome c family protein